ncbi:MAG: hypothetical protein AB1635_20305 [Acidobacteriota bacterium]
MANHLPARASRVRPALRAAAVVGLVVAGATYGPEAQQRPTDPLPMGPARERGASITPAFEGWYENEDGSFSLLIGYFNRNSKEPLDIPIGPNNRIEPGEPDQGQPTHFETGRQWGVFVVKVPKDFGTKKVTWTIVSNGETQSIPFALHPAYPVTPFKELGMGNQPPTLAFAAGGPKVMGPPSGVAATFAGTAGQPVPLTVWVEDFKPEGGEGGNRGPSGVATVSFHKYRGPGTVTFDRARVSAKTQGEQIVANATFSTPGEYILRVQANDESGEGGGGFQCCWTNAHIRVTVK